MLNSLAHSNISAPLVFNAGIVPSSDLSTGFSANGVTKLHHALCDVSGANNATLAREDGGSSNHNFQYVATKAASILNYRASVYAKYFTGSTTERHLLFLMYNDNSGFTDFARARFSVRTGLLVENSTAAVTFALRGAGSRFIRDGWRHYWFEFSTDTLTTLNTYLQIATTAGTTNYAGDNASGWYMCGYKVEQV